MDRTILYTHKCLAIPLTCEVHPPELDFSFLYTLPDAHPGIRARRTGRNINRGGSGGKFIHTVNSEGLLLRVSTGIRAFDPKPASQAEPVIQIIKRARAQGLGICMFLFGGNRGPGRKAGQVVAVRFSVPGVP